MKRLKDKSDAPEARHGTLPKHIQAQRERQGYIPLARGRVGTSGSVKKKELEEREFVVGSGAGMHMVSKRDFNSAELETMRISKNPTTVMTANGEVRTRKEATVYVEQWGLFVTVLLLDGTLAVLSLGKLCEDHGYTYHWTSGQKPHLIRNGKEN